jgi:hypothetical protein
MSDDTNSASTPSSRLTRGACLVPDSSQLRAMRRLPTDYINLDTDAAARLKWSRGREKYGDAFVGHPLLELDEELLDALNYVTEAERQGWDLGSMGTFLRLFRQRVRGAYLAKQRGGAGSA